MRNDRPDHVQSLTSRSSGAERSRWDAAVQELGGSVLQSWQWGEWYRHKGWQVERVQVAGPHGRGLAQILIRPRGRATVARLPMGPVLGGDGPAVARELFAAVDEVCARHHPLTLTIDPPTPLPRTATLGETPGFVQGTKRWWGPSRTVVVPLLDDQALLDQMHPKTRYNVRLAQRRGVVVEQAEADATTLATFYALLQETARRNEFTVKPLGYYEDYLRYLADETVLLFAHTKEGVAAGLIMTCFGTEAIYRFGASSSERRVTGATAYLQYEAMRRARARGCTRYDLWGIPRKDPPPLSGNNLPGSRGGDWQGLYHFKVGFGGDIVTNPPPLEQHYPARRYPERLWRALRQAWGAGKDR